MSDQITIQNSLNIDVQVYDSYSPAEAKNYYGTLTLLATIPSNKTQEITPVHSPICVLIAFDTAGNPIGRYVAMFEQKSFVITTKDLDLIQETGKFVDYIIANPTSALATGLKNALAGKTGGSNVTSVDAFFQQSTDYKDCTFASYMLVLTHKAQTPASASQPVEQRSYKLSMLCQYLSGTTWPAGFPDIDVKNFTCSDENDILRLGGTIELKNLPFGDSAVTQNILSLFPITEVTVMFMFDYQIGPSILGTRIQFISPDFHIPVGGRNKITISKPTVTIDINPLFKFVVFKVSSIIPFTIFKQKFQTQISMAIDNVEAEIGAVIEGAHNALPSPPLLKGVHFDEFGVGMGIVFEPPSFALGLQGKFHIGEGNTVVQLDDDTFALICTFEEEVSNPLYISFYVPKLDVPTLLAIFTDKQVNMDFPVFFSDLSFTWAENPMEPLALPDGTLTQMAFGFSGYMDLFGLQFYGQLEVNLNGVEGIITMSPLHFGNFLNISGDGKAVTMRVDDKGNPIRNNQVIKTKEMKEAIANAGTRQIITPGGPEMTINTSSSPYFTLDAQISLFEKVNEKINTIISRDGIAFELDFDSVISSTMKCVLKDYQDFDANFTFGLDCSILLPSGLGNLNLTTDVNAELKIKANGNDLMITLDAGFNFLGIDRSIPTFTVSLDIKKLIDLKNIIISKISNGAAGIFKDLQTDGGTKWIDCVTKKIITGVESVPNVLENIFGKSPDEAATITYKIEHFVPQPGPVDPGKAINEDPIDI